MMIRQSSIGRLSCTALIVWVAFFATTAIGMAPTTKTAQCQLRFLESNSWDMRLGGINICIDPVMDQLDFGIPSLYAGNKRIINGLEELNAIAERSDFILISQGFDDHAHKPTLQRLSKMSPNMPYICPPSAAPILESCGISSTKITTLRPGDKYTFEKNNSAAKKVEILATTGALLGPPWQQKENGYIVSVGSAAKSLSIYYEPHCMFDEEELAQLKADVVITPVVSQELPAFTLVAGGGKALKLARLLNAKYIVPMRNGNLKQEGLLSKIIKAEGSEQSFTELVQKSNKVAASTGAVSTATAAATATSSVNCEIKVVSAEPGKEVLIP